MAISARSERVWLSRRRRATGLSSMVRRRARNWIIWPTVTESSSTSMTGRLRARSRMSRKMRTRSTVSAAISGSAALIVLELAQAGIGPGGGLEHLLLLQHLGGVLEALMLQQPLDQLAARVLGGLFGAGGGARQQHLALDVDEQRGGVDKLAGHVHVAGLELVDVGQKLGRDLGDGNVVDVDVLLADQVQQQVERTVVDLVHDHREGREISFVVPRLQLDGRFRDRLLAGSLLQSGLGDGLRRRAGLGSWRKFDNRIGWQRSHGENGWNRLDGRSRLDQDNRLRRLSCDLDGSFVGRGNDWLWGGLRFSFGSWLGWSLDGG